MLHTTIIGNLGADAEVRNVNGNEFVSFNVAHSEQWKAEDGTKHEKSVWVSCTLNGNGGNLLPYLKKGTCIYAIGRTSTRVYSSEKERGFVAGINLSIIHIELVGGKSDDVPSRLFTEEGKMVRVEKQYGTNEQEFWGQDVKSKNGEVFHIDNFGLIRKINSEYNGF